MSRSSLLLLRLPFKFAVLLSTSRHIVVNGKKLTTPTNKSLPLPLYCPHRLTKEEDFVSLAESGSALFTSVLLTHPLDQ